MTSAFIERIAQEMHAEAFCIGMVKHSWLNTASDAQDGWRMIATAAITAMRDTATTDMLRAAENVGHLASDAEDVWRALIDHALDPAKEDA